MFFTVFILSGVPPALSSLSAPRPGLFCPCAVDDDETNVIYDTRRHEVQNTPPPHGGVQFSSRLASRATATRESVQAPASGSAVTRVLARITPQTHSASLKTAQRARHDVHSHTRHTAVQVTEPYDPSRPRSAHALQKGVLTARRTGDPPTPRSWSRSAWGRR